MAKFCGNCGAPMEDSDKVCGQCGTPVAGVVLEGNKATKNPSKNKAIGIIAVLIAAIIVAVIVVNIASNFTGYKGTLNKMVKALQKNDVSTLESLSSSIVDEAAIKQYYGDDVYMYKADLYDFYDGSISGTLDVFEDEVGEIKKISYDIIDEKVFSDRRLSDLKDNFEIQYNIDTSGLSKVVAVDLNLSVKGSQDTYNCTVYDIFMMKEDGDWKIFNSNIFSDIF